MNPEPGRDCEGIVDLDVPNAWETLPVRRRRRQRVTVLLDPDDDAAVVAALLNASDPAGPVVTVHPTPAMRSASSLAHDILAALGRPVRHLGAEKSATPALLWHAVRAWIAAEDIERLVVLRADRLHRDAWNAMVDLWRETGVGVVMVCHATSRTAALAMLPSGVNARVVASVATLLRHFPAARPPDVDPEIEVLPEVPDVDVVAFRAEAFRRLSRAEFAQVDEVYRSGMAAACRWLHGNPGPIKPVSGIEQAIRNIAPRGVRPLAIRAGAEAMTERYGESELRHLAAGLLCLNGPGPAEMEKLPFRFDDDDDLDRFLTGLVADAPTRDHTITLLRGAQAGALPARSADPAARSPASRGRAGDDRDADHRGAGRPDPRRNGEPGARRGVGVRGVHRLRPPRAGPGPDRGPVLGRGTAEMERRRTSSGRSLPALGGDQRSPPRAGDAGCGPHLPRTARHGPTEIAVQRRDQLGRIDPSHDRGPRRDPATADGAGR